MGEQPLFTEPAKHAPCSWNECVAGHRWPPTLVIAQCTGCGCPVVARKRENCPFCNEPIGLTSTREDFVPVGAGIAQRCKGAVPAGETIDVELTRHAWAEAQDQHLTFEAKREQEAKT